MTEFVRVREAAHDVTVNADYAKGLGDAVEILDGAVAVDHRGRPLPPAPKGERRAVEKSAANPGAAATGGSPATNA